MLPPPPEPEAEHLAKPDPTAPAPAIGMIPIPNPFKAFKPRETAKPLTKTQNRDGRLLVGTEKDVGACWNWEVSDEEDETVRGMKVCGEGHADGDKLVLIWSDMRVLVYAAETGREDLRQCHELQAGDVVDAHLTSIKNYVLMRQSGVEVYNLRKTDRNGDPASALKDTLYYCDKTSSNVFESEVQAIATIPLLGQLCVVTAGRSSPESGLVIGLQNLDRDAKRNERVWEGQKVAPGLVETTAVLPVDVNSIFTAR
ncbi:hypothetical protein FRC12_017754, partial [Ceratobasidium sp. 428]